MVINVADLVNRIEEKSKEKIVYKDEFLDADLEIKKLPLKQYLSIQEKAKKSPNELDVLCEIIYRSVPIFQSEELQEYFEIKMNTYSVIPKIYADNLGAMIKVVNFINSLYGIEDEEKK